MKLAFCLFNYFPYGGLQRDFLRIAEACKRRGHDIQVYTQAWLGDSLPDFDVKILKGQGLQNHTRCRTFVNKLSYELRAAKCDLVIGFNKMPNLDVYYAADICLQSRLLKKNFLIKYLPRYQQMLALEKAVFARGKQTKIFLIAPQQQQQFIHHYQTEENRFFILPPGISKDRKAPPQAAKIRTQVRRRNLITQKHILLLFVGSGFRTKGLDRAIKGLAALPPSIRDRCKMYIIGEDHPQFFLQLGKKLGIGERIYFLGGRRDVPDFLLAADLLIHPAIFENTGTVLLEALVAGLPVLTVDSCGYAHYIAEAKAGIVLPSPFNQNDFNAALLHMITTGFSKQWRKNALTFANQADIYSLPERAADKIEELLGKN